MLLIESLGRDLIAISKFFAIIAILIRASAARRPLELGSRYVAYVFTGAATFRSALAVKFHSVGKELMAIRLAVLLDPV